MKSSRSYHADLIQRLKDPEFAAGYLNEALDDEDHRVFLLALGDIAEAYGVSRLAEKTHVSREHFYRMLSEKGNPEWETLRRVLNQIGFAISVRWKSQPPEAA